MSEGRQLRTWCRYLHARRIRSGRTEELLARMSADGELREEILSDAKIHGALRMSVHNRGAGAAFVEQTLVRLGLKEPEPVLASPVAEDSWTFTGRVKAAPRPSRTVSYRSWAAVGAAMAAALLLGIFALVKYGSTHREPRPEENTPSVASSPSGNPEIRPPNQQALKPSDAVTPPARPPVARLVQVAKDAKWKGGPPVGEQLPPGFYQLLAGTASVAFDAGPVVQLTAPCLLEIRDRDRAYLHHGQVRTESAGTSPGFNLETPTSALTDRGTQADVKVHDDGATDVLVYQGELEMEARALDGSPTDQVRIGIGGHKHVAAVSKSNQPLDRTHFKGVLRVNGETREFSNKDEYEQARRRLMEEFEKFQQNLPKALAPREMQGQIEINGKKTEVNSLESILEVQRKLLEQFSRMNVPSNPAGKGKQDFKGQININGQRFDFMNPQSFDEFRRRLLQPMNPPQRPSPR